MQKRTDSRSNAVKTTARLLQAQGYAATGLGQIIEESESPKGSFYFHFPGGKEQLATEAVEMAGNEVLDVLQGLRAKTETPGELLVAMAKAEARQMQKSGFELGCPLATVTLEMACRSESIRTAAEMAFASWAEVFVDALAEAGKTDPRALADWALATLEGALMLARAREDTGVILSAARLLAEVLDAPAVASTRRSPKSPSKARRSP